MFLIFTIFFLSSPGIEAIQEMTEAQYQFLTNLISGILGAGSSIIIQWIAKKRTPTEERKEETNTQTTAAAANVATALEVNSMLKDLLEKERLHFNQQIDEARKACHQQIETLRENLSEEYDDIITKMKEESRRTTDELTKKIIELRARLSRYENDVVTGKHRAITSDDLLPPNDSTG